MFATTKYSVGYAANYPNAVLTMVITAGDESLNPVLEFSRLPCEQENKAYPYWNPDCENLYRT